MIISSTNELIIGIALITFVITVLVLDMRLLQRNAHFPSFKEASLWTLLWIVLALAFNVGVWIWGSPKTAMEFLTGYIVEESLSIDNIFVFIVIFSYFKVPKEYEHKILFWGILGAIVFRFLFIGVGAALISRFEWILYLFGAFLIYTAIKLAVKKETEVHPENNPFLKFARKIFPVSRSLDGSKFFTRQNSKLYATPLFFVLLMIESTDIVFAFDSIPAIFGITKDVFIVFTSNIFAILGLRSLYFLIAGLMVKFRYLQTGLSFVLGFIGTKMLIADYIKIEIHHSLIIIFGILFIAFLASLIPEKRKNNEKQN
jgi:tellurite resistance protein TerC